MLFQGKKNEYLRIEDITSKNCHFIKENIESSLTLIWFTKGKSEISIDNQKYIFQENDIVFLTEYHKVIIHQISHAKMIRFNRDFYCIVDHDSTVGCKGILFYGNSRLPIMHLPAEELEKFETLMKMFEMEMFSKDELQMEMLQMMLKRTLILCTRFYKEANQMEQVENSKLDIVREFNYLVESNYKKIHSVSEYAKMLHKSPKTLTNYFLKSGVKKPLQIIQERRVLEAKRLLSHTSMQIKEIAYEIGYNDVQSFSRFFKKQEGISPLQYKEKYESAL
ncbi:helix-turn-helix domain-containing protein [Aureivirga marina]|uniref:helix-turn-helix domain-containing protein n=1 Tax=Aureivirga marina TaxID=1182451 RepID=UPI0018CB3CC9|nr:AraC family transcriptional regulator [Aureivirga marina]